MTRRATERRTAPQHSIHLRAGQPRPQDVKAEILIWTNCSSLHPGVEQRTLLGLRAGSGLTPSARRPGPAYQMVATDMMYDVVGRAAAVARGILDLRADLPDRPAFPAHLARRQMPARSAGHAARVEIRLLMTDRTTHRRQAEAILAACDRRLMQAADVALTRTVAGRMAVHAPRMLQHFGGFGEEGRRPRCG